MTKEISKLLPNQFTAQLDDQLTDDVKRAKRPLNNNQTPERANKTKKKCQMFLHRGKPKMTGIIECYTE